MPNIDTDVLRIVSGGTVPLPVVGGAMLLTSPGTVVMTGVFPDSPGESPYRFRVTHDVQVGTVAELTAHYGRQLARTYHTAATSPDWDRVAADVARQYPGHHGVSVPGTAEPGQIDALLPGGVRRDELARLVLAYVAGKPGAAVFPKLTPAVVRELIAALTEFADGFAALVGE